MLPWLGESNLDSNCENVFACRITFSSLFLKFTDLGTFFLVSSFARIIPENNNNKKTETNKIIGNLYLKLHDRKIFYTKFPKSKIYTVYQILMKLWK